MAQGLASDSITAILTDSRGYMWFGTLDGLSRYDGQQFVTYSTDDGIPGRMIWAIAEDRSGGVWVGSDRGLVRMTPAARRGAALFRPVASPTGSPVTVGTIFIDRKGTMWVSCQADLCMVQGERLVIDQSFRLAGGNDVLSIVDSPSGDLWVATGYCLMRRAPDGSWRRYSVQPFRGTDGAYSLMVDADGRLWITNNFGLLIFAPKADDALDTRPLIQRVAATFTPGTSLRWPRPGEVVSVRIPSAIPIINCKSLFRSSEGAVWIPTFIGALRILDRGIDFFDAHDGLPPLDIMAVGEDPSGNVWIGTRGAGALRLARAGATTYTREHGLANERIMSLVPLDDGSMCAVDRRTIACFRDGQTHRGVLFPRTARFQGWGWNQTALRDRTGAWWFATGDGLVRWPAVRRIEDLGRVAPAAVYTLRDGLDNLDVFRVWQDSRGEIWVGTFGDKPLSRGDPATGRFKSYGTAEGFVRIAPTAFAEDRAGNVWIGLYTGGLFRVTGGTRFERITRELPGGFVRALKIDSKGRLWMAADGGVARIDDPTREAVRLAIRRYSRRDGLAADSGYSLAETGDGRMAIGSQRGLDLLDAATGSIVHVSTRDGLASNEVSVAAIDRAGGLWLGTVNGLSHLPRLPQFHPVPPAPPRIQTVDIDGVREAAAELGGSAMSGVRIKYPRHAMTVGFSAPHYDPSRPLRFEYRLDGERRWVDAGAQRAIVFDHLPSGARTLEVRTVAVNGSTSPPATLSFQVIPPVWRRTWFVGLAVFLVMAATFAVHRYRVSHLLELERVRTRVATDLHDDLGSSLSRISILSEAAKRHAVGGRVEALLDEIAGTARGLVDALGDTLWSIDPRRDDVQSLLLHVHQFAAAVFEAQSISIDLSLPDAVAVVRLDPEQRREIYLILKEALNNVARHAQPRHVDLRATAENGSLQIVVQDDGKGFAVQAPVDQAGGGRGVPSMKERAHRIGGTLLIASEAGRGTRITVAVPV